MKSSPAIERRPSPSRWRRWTVPVAVLGLLALTAGAGWHWFQDRVERSEALQLAGQRRFDAAEPLLLHSHGRHPRNVEIVRALALGYFDTRRYPEAETFLKQWCELRPEDAEPYRRRLDLWNRQQNVTAALADTEQILRLDPGDFETRLLRVNLLVLDGQYATAGQEAVRALRIRPNNVQLQYFLAKAAQGQQRPAEATHFADIVLHTKPDFTPGLQLRAELYLDAGQPEPAVRLLQQAAAHAGAEQTSVLYQLSAALTRAGRDEEAKQALAEMQWRRALAIWSQNDQRDENPAVQARVVEAMLAAGKIDDAVQFLNGILSRNPKAPAGTHELLAKCFERQGHPERAAEHRRRAGGTP
jgi:tetratricopeptide (TPR) repeat protein